MFEHDESLQAFTRYKDRPAFPGGRKIIGWLALVLAPCDLPAVAPRKSSDRKLHGNRDP